MNQWQGGAGGQPAQAQAQAPSTQGSDYQVYIGNLDPNVTNNILMQHFAKKYPSVYEAKVIVDM
jgi:hypothetical protein